MGLLSFQRVSPNNDLVSEAGTISLLAETHCKVIDSWVGFDDVEKRIAHARVGNNLNTNVDRNCCLTRTKWPVDKGDFWSVTQAVINLSLGLIEFGGEVQLRSTLKCEDVDTV